MKIVVSCDALVARDYAVSVVESMLLLFENAELYSIVHHEGAILGPIEQRKIHSSFLSHLLTDDQAFSDNWWKKAYLIPGALKKLHIPCCVDLVINISSGFSQGISKCESVKQITYLVENQFDIRAPKFLREKIFRGYLESWAEKAVIQADEIWVPTQKSADFWSSKHQNVKVLAPFFKASDFPLFPDAIRKTFARDFFAIEANYLSIEKAEELIKSLLEKKIKFKFVGRDEQLSSLKSKYENKVEFWGERCSGELAPFLAASRGYISFQKNGFPVGAVTALSTGSAIWMDKESSCLDFLDELNEGVFSSSNFLGSAENIFNSMDALDVKKIHGTVQKFHDLKFRAWVKRQVDLA